MHSDQFSGDSRPIERFHNCPFDNQSEDRERSIKAYSDRCTSPSPSQNDEPANDDKHQHGNVQVRIAATNHAVKKDSACYDRNKVTGVAPRGARDACLTERARLKIWMLMPIDIMLNIVRIQPCRRIQ